METDSYYQILGLSSDASSDEIRRAFRSLARQFHPDTNPDQNAVDVFQKVSEAYSVLSDPDRRLSYDLKMGLGEDSPGESAPQNNESEKNGEGRRERKLSKVDIQHLHKMAREGYDDQAERKSKGSTGRFKQNDSGGNSVNRLAVKSSLVERIGQYFKRVVRKVEKRASAAAVKTEAPKTAAVKKDRPGRVFVFTIDALESITGTIREAAFDELGEPRVIKIRIPAGVHDDVIVDVPSVTDDPTEMEVVRARIRITPHKIVDRDGYDITIKVPVTIGEMVSGTDLEIPTPNGVTKIHLPARWNVEQKFRVKGCGLHHAEKKFKGDLYVQPIIIPPDHSSPALDEAAKMVDSFYFGNVRSNFPKNLFDTRRN